MIRIYHLIIFTAVILLITACMKEDTSQQNTQEKGGVLTMDAGAHFDNKIIPVHYFIPKGDIDRMQVQIILHGNERNAREYIAAWAQKAREFGLILLAPELSEAQFNTTLFQEGNAVVNGQLNTPEKTTFHLLDKVFEFSKEELSFLATSFHLYGHSAGAQLVHRMVEFYDSPFLKSAVAANAGWYTFPDENISFPYGIRSLVPDAEIFRKQCYQKNLIILLGTADTLRTGGLRVTAQADNQGKNRLERGMRFFQFNEDRASSQSQSFQWKLFFARDIGHDHTLMSKEAADILYP